MRTLLILIISCCIVGLATAQCPFTPTVTGDLLVCPEARTTLGTQAYDAYQWYTRPFGSSAAPQPVNGATGPAFTVDYNDTPLYVSVSATLNNCTERSAEVLVDGLVFLLPVALSDGEFTIGPNGEAVICAGDTMHLIALSPYTTNIKWFDGEEAIPGANDDTLIVTRPGSYWFTGAPQQCPDFTASLGLRVEVVWSDIPGCATAVRELQIQDVLVWPNPASDRVAISVAHPGAINLTLLDITGRPLWRSYFDGQTEVPMSAWPEGMYILQLSAADGAMSRYKLIKNSKQ
ncbi:MAG TPA: T9SS type A sorting domain-containing protein [Saprospiraceae bacterium]|nr:T9SS type A sorting domain-containing protein [Saprospiraceae bacterium]HRJ13825.1 T9SS type A sorting domain-containing protein [Saprospiraceae bacterium]HRK82808.1 T9SS type A sorting domain-containing protein [Saprospiraceae bacterium]